MPSAFDIRSDLVLLLSKSVQTKNSRINTSQLEQYMIPEKRARGIREESHRKSADGCQDVTDPMGRMLVTPVTSGDDPNVPQTCKEVGKVILPGVVSLPEDRGIYRISSSSRKDVYYPIESSRFWDIPSENVRAKFKYYSRIGRALYLRPAPTEINAQLILDNPMDGFVLLTHNVQPGELTIGDSFTVVLGSVVHNSITYSATGTNTFVAVNENFTGTGTVQYTLQKRRMTNKDPYPLSFTLTDYIIMKILTQDFKIEESNVADVINDAKDQLVALQNTMTR